MATRPVLGLIATLNGLRELGEDPGPILRRHGIVLERMDPGARLDRTLELRLHLDLAASLANPAIGMQLGEFMSFAAYGPFTMLLLSCTDGRQAIAEGIRYQDLSYLFSTLDIAAAPRYSALTLTFPLQSDPGFRFRIDTEVSGTLKLINDLQATLGMSRRPHRIDLPYPKPREAANYERYYGCPVRFGEDQARIWIDNGFVQMPFPSADPNAHAVYQRLCDQQLKELQQESDTGLVGQVRDYLSLYQGRMPGAGEVSRFLGLSERSLRRHLSEQGTGLRELAGSVRCHKARQLLLESRLSIEAIAERLGYAEAAAFTHAFRRWCGITPLAFRLSQGQVSKGASREQRQTLDHRIQPLV